MSAETRPESPRGMTHLELEHIALTGRRALAHALFRALPPVERARVTSKYVFTEVVLAGMEKLRELRAASAVDAADDETAFIERTMRLFVDTSRRLGRSRELYDLMLCWSEALTVLSLPDEALAYYDEAAGSGIERYPDLNARCVLGKAILLDTLGRKDEAQSLFETLAERPYLLPERNLVPAILFHLGRNRLESGDVGRYKSLLFRGLRLFYTSTDERRRLFTQLYRTYRWPHRLIFDRSVRPAEKALSLSHGVWFAADRLRLARALKLTSLLRLGVLGSVYALNYVPRSPLEEASPPPSPRSRHVKRRGVLVTRAMGGIGDLLMMTPGFHALRQKRPSEEIHLAIPRRYFPVFEGNPDLELIDIQGDALPLHAYRRWFNFTDCPAARVESRTAPRVRRSRIDIFASALGLGPLDLFTLDRRPRYFVSEAERQFQRSFFASHGLTETPVVGIQLRSDEIYRDYALVGELVRAVSKEMPVLLFDTEPIPGHLGQNVLPIGGLPMRQAFALVAGCAAIVAPDSAFVHLAGALSIPCVALYGPIDGKVRTRFYPRCISLDTRKELGCIPCWRNERIPCGLTGLRTSACMAGIPVPAVQEALARVLGPAGAS